MTPPVTASNGTFTQPAQCYNSRNLMPDLPSNINYYNQVPLWQENDPHRDMEAVLQSCCAYPVWITEDPDPCFAICRSHKSKEAKEVMYCLNAEGIVYGSKTEISSGVRRAPATSSSLVSLVLGGILLSGMFL
ncbi:hypothetical protein N7457_005739 [Penicillium paradoxum]|uniref:uncharacterized protein n=1 Tax=Penicillium paradoxum TaxID=176176 RepID=UPI0025468C10|nr:uncharacterized protein N7457_005739 [Penicillium paradoxum]KAJ5780579.1 hypothetical protein N7457_005739 [Penicillium paradoxum]